jgi:peptide chain release factor 2
LDDGESALELAKEDEEFLEQALTTLNELALEVSTLELESLLDDPIDTNNALLTINAGAGGTESCDWASMLLRMYLRFAEKNQWTSEIHDLQEGEEAGVKSVTLEIQGTNAFGFLKAENGVHRLVRISPFDSNARRHTSFVSVFATPVIDDDIEISINPADLKVDTYRASGAGGQHVNRTDSAVRLTHMPTGIVVQCQSQRSQHQNKDTALKMLKSKLYEREIEKRNKKRDEIEASKSDINFGSQIRSYVLHPYKLVKDHRTDYESHDPTAILDGDLMKFIEEFLSKDKLS